jgi:DNA polymerase-3 subunit beta
MKCTLTKEQLIEAVLMVEKTTVKNHTLPVLSCVLVEVKDNKLFLTSTNLEVGLCFNVDIKNGENGKVAVSGSVLLQVVSSLQNGTEITFETDDNYLIIKNIEGVSKISTHDIEDFPVLPEVDGGKEIFLPAKDLKDAINSVVYCASLSTIKPELSSVFIHPNGNNLIAVATDSFRLAEKKISLKKNIESEPFLIPAKSTSDLLRVLEYVKNDVKLSVNKHQLSLSIPNIYLTLRLVSGTFPDYTQIIPKEFVTEATMLVFDFERAIKKAGAFRDQFNQTTFTISPKNKKLVLYTKNENIGETKDSISAALTGEDLTISFNQKYLADSLHSINSDSITIQFAGQSQPAVIKPVGNDGFIYLVMPMNR